MTERKPFWKPAVGVLEEIGKSFLFLVFMYYSTQAVLKYWEEPAVTNIQYTFGDNEKGTIHLRCRQFFTIFDPYPPHWLILVLDPPL